MMAAREIDIARRRLLMPNGDNGRDTRDGFAPQKLLAITSGPKRQLNERASLQTAPILTLAMNSDKQGA